MDTAPLVAAFVNRLPAGALSPAADVLGPALAERIDAARATWPAFDLDPHAFVGHLAGHSAGALPPLEHAADLYLACACALGVSGAHAAFDARYSGELARAVGRIDSSQAFIDDAIQVLHEKLFVPSEGEPAKILEYAGRSALKSWLAAAVVRTALNMRRRRDDRGHDELGSGVRGIAADAGPELEVLRTRYKREFEDSIRAALHQLSPKDRTILRLHLGDGLSIDRLGALYSVGRSTAARWLGAARGSLMEKTRAELNTRITVTESEFTSLAALVLSRLDVSVLAILERGEQGRGR